MKMQVIEKYEKCQHYLKYINPWMAPASWPPWERFGVGVLNQHIIKTMKTHQKIAAYIETLVIGQGRYAGQKFKLLPWQKRFLKGAFAQDEDAALSMGRGGGKTTFTAAIACSTVDVDGPLVEPMAETLVVASSFDQGLKNFRHMQHFLEPSFEKYGVGGRGRFRV